MPKRLLLPITLSARGDLRTVEQDSPIELSQSVALLLDTRVGERRSEPDYGTPDPVFGGLDVDELADAIEEWEDRVSGVQFDFTQADGGVLQYLSVHPLAGDSDAEVVV